MTKRFLFGMVVATVFGLSFLGVVPRGSTLLEQDARAFPSERDEHERILTIDRFVSHISTVPANTGEQVKLFVRERVQRAHHRDRAVVLMVPGATISTVPDFDLPAETYSWMDYLAHAGFDVFAIEHTGYGLSPRPMMDDPCNTSLSEQALYLVPNPLSEPCAPTYPFRLTTIQSDWDEIDTVVDYLRQLRHVEKVIIVGWSRGGPRAGGYAARHSEKVERLLLYAPQYSRLAPRDPPDVLPEPGVPTTVLGSAKFHASWDSQVNCDNQFNPAVREVITSTMLEFDPLGSTWGAAGVRRAPVFNTSDNAIPYWGWNAEFAQRIDAPTLLIRGDLDTLVPEADVRALYEDLASAQKVFVHVACASHFLLWENQHMILLRASREWLRHGTFARHDTGSFAVDVDGVVHEE